MGKNKNCFVSVTENLLTQRIECNFISGVYEEVTNDEKEDVIFSSPYKIFITTETYPSRNKTINFNLIEGNLSDKQIKKLLKKL